jgi:hypothetical protein
MDPRGFHAFLLGSSVPLARALLLTIAAALGRFDDMLAFGLALLLVPAGLGGFCALWLRRADTVGAARKRVERAAAHAFLTPLAIVRASLLLHRGVRGALFTAFATRSERVVEAIERHLAERGAPPASLDALVPEYLSTVPTTAMAAYPEYSDARERNGWTLEVECSPGFAAFDWIEYRPGTDAPGSTERYGDWLLLHD